ncbi:MAG: sterol desaturase family protein [Myxococcales bacterium]|nr:sterol desaturase family protein [Myxococcales bacterium]MCB9630063.1 sterol desaturase family protein [Sandaracinaceae bacterium]
MTMFAILMFSYVCAGIALAVLHFLYRSDFGRRHMISDDPHRSVDDRRVYRDAALNTVVSVTLIFSVTFGLGDYLFYATPTPVWVMVVEALAVVLIYDFAYYFFHRFPLHEWKLLRWVHAVHHAARNPRTIDSLLLHPIETVGGLGLLFTSIAVVGGIHLYTFAVIFATYAVFNILNHAGVNIPRFPFKTLGVLAVKHDRHHHSMLSGNYASITPLPDMVFGTVA